MKPQTKDCLICEQAFPKRAKGPWCHGCVCDILRLLGQEQKSVARLVETTEKIRNQLRKAKAEGKKASTTDVPGPYWGLDLS